MKKHNPEIDFAHGLDAGKHCSRKQDADCLEAIASRTTSAADRAFWTGYACQRQILAGADLMDLGRPEQDPLNIG